MQTRVRILIYMFQYLWLYLVRRKRERLQTGNNLKLVGARWVIEL